MFDLNRADRNDWAVLPMTTAPGSPTDAAAPDRREQRGSVALDQWRGFALVLVLVAHAFHASHRVDGLGRIGVNLFFFISGILVFRSLARGRETSRPAVALSFWGRRLRRLYPALLAYVGVLALGQYWLQSLPGQPAGANYLNWLKHLPVALLYGINYAPATPMSLGHLWSLACEMQFYLLSPLIFFLGGTAPGRRQWVFGGIFLVLFCLGAAEPHFVRPFYDPKYHFEFAVWPMMAGFWCEFQRDAILRLPLNWMRAAFWGILGVSLACLPLMLLGPGLKLPVIAAGALLLVPCWLGYLLGWPLGGVAGQSLRWLGERTYSIYLWQQPFTICAFLPVAWWAPGAALSVFWGGLWFRWFERPFLSRARRQPVAACLGTKP
jgi:peptidoglycan/LPS O-acetylase OafA/YrhL